MMTDIEQQSTFHRFAEAAQAVGATTKRLEKLAVLAQYLGEMSDVDLPVAARLLAGSPFPVSDDRTLNVGWRVTSNVLVELSGMDAEMYNARVVLMGDMGDVAGQIMPAEPHVPGQSPSLQDAVTVFEEIASTRGTGKKQALLHDLLARATPLEAK